MLSAAGIFFHALLSQVTTKCVSQSCNIYINMKTNPKNNTMAFVVSKKLKEQIIEHAQKKGIKVSSFVASTMEEKINELIGQDSLSE